MAGKELVGQHLRTIMELVDGIMVPDLGLIGDNTITPEFRDALDHFLLVRNPSHSTHPDSHYTFVTGST